MSDAAGFKGIIGQNVAIRTLRKAVSTASPAHTYAFVGPEGTGKCTVAREFARALNCTEPQNGAACGKCANCRTIAHGNIPDIRVWSPDGKNTKIDQMRDMRHLASFAPLKGRWKVNIVEQGDTLNEDSANAILKLLEEPPDYLVNILLYRSPAAMLSTIRSRCRIVRFAQVPADELAEQLVERFGRSQEEAEFLAAFSQGCPGTAVRLMDDKEFFKRRDEVIRAAAGASENPWLCLKNAEFLKGGNGRSGDEDDESSEFESVEQGATQRLGKRTAAVEGFDVLLSWYGDLLSAAIMGSEAALVNSDKRDAALEQASRFSDTEAIVCAIDAITVARSAVLGNANPQIATEALLIQLASH